MPFDYSNTPTTNRLRNNTDPEQTVQQILSQIPYVAP